MWYLNLAQEEIEDDDEEGTSSLGTRLDGCSITCHGGMGVSFTVSSSSRCCCSAMAALSLAALAVAALSLAAPSSSLQRGYYPIYQAYSGATIQ